MPSRAATPPRLPYMPGLDGLRGLAVLAVLAYHAQLPGSDGGFLGVEVFFVLSGYLITGLLLLDLQHRGRPDLGRFWLRRARRLLPALWLLLLVTPAAAAVLATDALPRLREDTLAALAYVTNWVYIFRDIPYFEHYGRPPLLQHLWSLAIEEQFYLLWPLLVGLTGLLAPRRHRGVLLALSLALAAASTVWRWALYVPFDDATRVYYGTDTRASGLLLGAALAVVWPPQRVRGEPLRARARVGAEALGALGLAALPVLFARLNDYTPTLYRGGFLLTDAATLAVLVGVAHPDTWVGRALGWAPLRWVGQRSYGLYLWHWPVFVLLRPGVDWPLGPWPALLVHLALTFGLAAASYRWVEQPIRRHGWRAWLRQVRRWAASPPRRVALGAALLGLLALDMWALRPGPATPPPAEGLEAAVATPALPAPTRTPTRPAPPPTAPVARPTPTAPHAPAVRGAPSPTPSPTATPTPSGPRVTIIGDSVMQAAVTFDFWAPWGDQVVVDVQEGRKMQHLPDLVAQLAAQGRLAPVVVVHLGTNRPFPPEALDQAMQALLDHGVQRVYFLNIRRPVRWEDFVNETLAEGVARWPQARLLDWHSLALEHPEWFVEDGTHLRYYGAQAYVQFIMEAVSEEVDGLRGTSP